MQIQIWMSVFAGLTSAAALYHRNEETGNGLCIARGETCYIAQSECCDGMLCFLDFDSYQTYGPNFKCQTLEDSLQNLGRAFNSVLDGWSNITSSIVEPPNPVIVSTISLPSSDSFTLPLIIQSTLSSTLPIGESFNTSVFDTLSTRMPIPIPIITPTITATTFVVQTTTTTATFSPERFSSVEIPIPTIEPSFPPLSSSQGSSVIEPIHSVVGVVTSETNIATIIPSTPDFDEVTEIVSSVDDIIPLPTLTPLALPDIVDIFDNNDNGADGDGGDNTSLDPITTLSTLTKPAISLETVSPSSTR